MTASLRVVGVSALAGRFVRAAALGTVATVGAVEVLGQEVADAARRMVPVDTGALRDSITAERGRVFTDVEYAGPVEYGTSDTEAQPFMRPAADTVDAAPALGLAASVMRKA
jgi:HK97 gp10 family phage protein